MEADSLPQFALLEAQWSLSFAPEVVATLESHRQHRWYKPESVGQLFSRDLTQAQIHVATATLLKPSRSSRFSVTLNIEQAAEQRSILLADGLHCIGLWHTHPESKPQPSSIDARLAADHALAARAVLNGLCFVIVGSRRCPEGWYIGVHDGSQFHHAPCKESHAMRRSPVG
jgi:proteasome lid subunit RPN8/RPN11